MLNLGLSAAHAAQSYTVALQHWAKVLRTHVDAAGVVDFAGLARAPQDLDAFVEYIGQVSPNSAPALFPTPAARLAYHINAYNALAMHNVIDSDMPASLTGFRKIIFFVFKRFRIGGESMSLYTYENDVIRPLGDERVHFALNCMAAGCPRLPQVPFTADHVDQQLDREARRFFSDPRNLQRSDATKQIRLSELLDFYEKDFLKRSPSLIAYVNRHLPEQIPLDYGIAFIDYDWTVKAQPWPRQ